MTSPPIKFRRAARSIHPPECFPRSPGWSRPRQQSSPVTSAGEPSAANSIPAGLADATPARSSGAGAGESVAAWRADVFPADKVHNAIMRARVAALATEPPELGVGPVEHRICIDRPRPGDRRRRGNRFCRAHRGLGCCRGGQQAGHGGREAAQIHTARSRGKRSQGQARKAARVAAR